MSYQLSNLSSPYNTPFVAPEYTTPKTAVIINGFFFASLALILCAAFLAILVKSWLREFDRGMISITVSELRATERESQLLSLERWRVPEIVALLPIFLQASLALFCAGLIVFLREINSVIAAITLAIFAIMALLYVLTKFAVLFDHLSPFSSSNSRVLRDWLQVIGWEIPKLWAKWAGEVKWAFSNTHWMFWPSTGVAAAASSFGVMVRLILIVTRAVPWYSRPKILKRKREYQYSYAVRATVQSLNRLGKVTVKAPDNTPIFLSFFDEALLAGVAILPSSRWSGIIRCLSVGEGDLSLQQTRDFLRVIAFIPQSWDYPIPSLPLTPVVLRELEENISHPVDILFYYVLQALIRVEYFLFSGNYDEILLELHWNQICAAIASLRVCDDKTLHFIIDLAKLAGYSDPPFRFPERFQSLLFAITTYLQTAMSNESLERTKLMPLIAATLQSFCITAGTKISGFPCRDLLTGGSDLFGMPQEPRLETIDFRPLQQAWSALDMQHPDFMATISSQ